jgi:hypothetical protein
MWSRKHPLTPSETWLSNWRRAVPTHPRRQQSIHHTARCVFICHKLQQPIPTKQGTIRRSKGIGK